MLQVVYRPQKNGGDSAVAGAASRTSAIANGSASRTSAIANDSASAFAGGASCTSVIANGGISAFAGAARLISASRNEMRESHHNGSDSKRRKRMVVSSGSLGCNAARRIAATEMDVLIGFLTLPHFTPSCFSSFRSLVN